MDSIRHSLIIKVDEIEKVKLNEANMLQDLATRMETSALAPIILTPGVILWIDDEAHIFEDDPEINWPATNLAASFLGFSSPDLICGTAVVTGPEGNLSQSKADEIMCKLIENLS